ncbi:macro domain-containing protein [Streptomyces parvulus]|uniref:macro domain-containing protein n=1 Tax=Streptomyces parvulus TaxID=146923 RepID=UPI003D74FC1E
MRDVAREVLLTRQGIGAVASASLAAFGLLSAAFQVALAVWPGLTRHDLWILVSLFASCLLVGLWRAWPRFETNHDYRNPSFAIQVKCGDVLNESSNVIVGFTDTFDTDLEDGVVINPRSVQGQFQHRFYGGSTEELDSQIEAQLSCIEAADLEDSEDKPKGKLARYPIGTTIVLRSSRTRFYAAAYGYMRNDLRVSCSVDSLWKSLTSAWDAVRVHGGLDPVAVPVIGSELARVGSLDRTSLIKMIALSFVASSREEIVSRQLTIVVHPKDRQTVNLIDVEKFLRTL